MLVLMYDHPPKTQFRGLIMDLVLVCPRKGLLCGWEVALTLIEPTKGQSGGQVNECVV